MNFQPTHTCCWCRLLLRGGEGPEDTSAFREPCVLDARCTSRCHAGSYIPHVACRKHPVQIQWNNDMRSINLIEKWNMDSSNLSSSMLLLIS
jgi:hypothetical protein